MQRICAGSVSTHALREEGDKVKTVRSCNAGKFQSTPSARRATRRRPEERLYRLHFNPRPPRGGRHGDDKDDHSHVIFQSTPSARRATGLSGCVLQVDLISIHALREEGDLDRSVQQRQGCEISIHALREEGDWSGSRLRRPWRCNFNPRPPRGGRQGANSGRSWQQLFQSTPSARRATRRGQSTTEIVVISIHALREEGDSHSCGETAKHHHFNPRPPRGGRPRRGARNAACGRISIHALREEGDAPKQPTAGALQNFNPRPPRGGRLTILILYTDRC